MTIYEQFTRPSPERFLLRTVDLGKLSPAASALFQLILLRSVGQYNVTLSNAVLGDELNKHPQSASRAMSELRKLDLVQTIATRKVIVGKDGRKRNVRGPNQIRLTYRTSPAITLH